MTLRSEDEGARSTVKVAVLKAFFEGTEGELAYALRRESDEFDYGYALTVHKAQGSQWDASQTSPRSTKPSMTPSSISTASASPIRWPCHESLLILVTSA
jgi:hypothetical protein